MVSSGANRSQGSEPMSKSKVDGGEATSGEGCPVSVPENAVALGTPPGLWLTLPSTLSHENQCHYLFPQNS